MKELAKKENKQTPKQYKKKMILKRKLVLKIKFKIAKSHSCKSIGLLVKSKFGRSQVRKLKLNIVMMTKFIEFQILRAKQLIYYDGGSISLDEKSLHAELRKYHHHRLQNIKILLKYKMQRWIAYKRLVQIYCEVEDYDKALDTLAKAPLIQVCQSQIQFQYGKVNTLQGKYEEALQHFNKTIQIDPSFAEAYYQKSLLLAHFERRNEANDALEDYLQRKDIKFEDLQSLQVLFYQFGNFEKFYHYCKLTLINQPQNDYVLQILGVTYYYQQNWNQAAYFLQKSLQLNPKHDHYCYWLARCFMQLRQYDKSLHYGYFTLEIDKDNEYCFRLGLQYFHRKDFYHALQIFTYIKQHYPLLTCPINYPDYVDKLVSQYETNMSYIKMINGKVSMSQIQLYQQNFHLINLLKRFPTMFIKTKDYDRDSVIYKYYKFSQQQKITTIYNPQYFFLGNVIKIKSKQPIYIQESCRKQLISFFQYKDHQCQDDVVLQMGIYYQLSGKQIEAKNCFLRLMKLDQIITLPKEQSWFSVFVVICQYYFKDYPKIQIIRYVQFMISQMMRQDGHVAMKCLSWLLNVQPWASQFFNLKNTAAQLIRKNVVKISKACQVISKLKVNFQHFEQKVEVNAFLSMINRYLKYSSKIINIIVAEKSKNKIQKQLQKMLVFPHTISLRRKITSKKSCYFPIFGVNEKINFSKITQDLLSLKTKQQKRKFMQALAFDHYLKIQLLKFTFNEIAFFFIQNKQSFRLAQLLTNIKTNPQFELKEVQQHLLSILQWSKTKAENDLKWVLCKAPEGSISYTSQQNSKISFKIDLQDQICEKMILMISLQFKHFDQKYLPFRQLVMKNVFLNANSLFHRSDSNRHIVKLLDLKNWQESFWEQGFIMRTKKGDIINCQFRDISDPDERMLFGIWQLGRTFIYSFLISTAKGIAEIELDGKFHCDIDFRNIVKFADIFKLIDFDYFFTVRLVGTKQADIEAYQNTMQLISQFFRLGQLKKEDNIINFLFPSLAQRYDANEDNYTCDFDYDNYIEGMLEKIRKSADKTYVLMKELEEYSYVFHLLQYERLIRRLLDPGVRSAFPNVMKVEQVEKILQCLGWLRNKQIGYKQFAQEVERIKVIKI